MPNRHARPELVESPERKREKPVLYSRLASGSIAALCLMTGLYLLWPSLFAVERPWEELPIVVIDLALAVGLVSIVIDLNRLQPWPLPQRPILILLSVAIGILLALISASVAVMLPLIVAMLLIATLVSKALPWPEPDAGQDAKQEKPAR